MAHILVVDDEVTLCASIVRSLQSDGHQLRVAHNLAAAEAAVLEREYDAAIVDLQLDDGNGLDLLRWLKRERPSCARLLVSGHLDMGITIGAVNRGEVSRVLTKPFSSTGLRRAVADSLAQSRQNLVAESGSDLRARLEHALDRDGLQLALQPVVDAATGGVVAYEGLLRCDDTLLGDPRVLVSAAQRHRMLRRVTAAVMASATGWLPKLPGGHDLFLNLHPEELADMGVLKALMGPLSGHASRIVLDITGHHQERWGDVLWDRLDQLRGMGFRFALDDVGAGHQGLLMLAMASPGFVKADRSIVAGVDSEPRKRRLLSLLARFADASDARLVAEGVETEAEAAVLRDVGVPLLQGYLFGRPTSRTNDPGQSH